MPNWCNNSVMITHTDPFKIKALAMAMEDNRFLEQVIPVPESLRIVAGRVGDDLDPKQIELEAQTMQNLSTYGYANWYDFCVGRWGTKWDVETQGMVTVSDDGRTVEAGFDSAWSPPLGVYEELVEQGYEVVGYYNDSGMGFVGKWDNGDDLCYDYSSCNSETVRGYIGDELDDYFGISESMAEYEAENEPTEELTEWIRDGADKRGLVTG